MKPTWLDPKEYYMNPETGSVATGSEWETDFDERCNEQDDWNVWGGDELIHVEKDEDGDWIMVR